MTKFWPQFVYRTDFSDNGNTQTSTPRDQKAFSGRQLSYFFEPPDIEM